jgi:hypothetical protein
VTVAASEAAKVALELTPSSVISGQVLDAKGQPVVNGSIEALRISYANGVKGLSAPIAGPRGRGNVTNDRGEYRLFGLPPGDYYLASSPPAPGSRGGDTSPDRREVLVRTFYPATINIAEAQIVTLRGGQDLTGMHIRRQMAPVITISGQVINDLPKATEVTARRGAGDATVARIQIVPSNKNAIVDPSVSMFANAALTAPNSGRFEYRGALAPGTYDLFADIDDPMGYGPAPSPQKRSYGRARVTLDGGDLRGITIAVRRGVEVKGRVTLEGKAEGTAGMQVMLQPDDNSTRISVLSSTGRNQHAIAPDGSFAIPFVPSARYRFQLGTIRGTSDPLVFTPLTDSYIADVLENGVSIYESGLSVGDQPPGRIEIRLKRDGGSIEGSVTDADGKPVLGATVILAPASQRREIVALYKSATSVRSGRFVISNIAPGDYRLLALQALESRAYEVPEFLDRYDDRAQRITVAGGGRLQAQLRIIPSTR